ncbi:MAG TPA: pentapeptide repeat-containing protein [Streptomyces sp.]
MTHPSPALRDWPRCGHGTSQDDPIGCGGIHAPGHTTCLAHLTDTDRTSYLAALTPGTDIDHRGTPFTTDLLSELLTALTNPTTGRPDLGHARFDMAVFTGDAGFENVRISGDAGFRGVEVRGDVRFQEAHIVGCLSFDRAVIDGRALFDGVRIDGDAGFDRARVGRRAMFDRARIGGDAGFDRMRVTGRMVLDGTEVGGDARFLGVQIGGYLSFDRASVGGDAVFDRAKCGLGAWFRGVRVRGGVSCLGAEFERTTVLGPLVCGRTLTLSEAVFAGAVTIEVSAADVVCRRTRWASTAALGLRNAAMDLSDAVLEHPVSVTARPRPFVVLGQEMPEFVPRPSPVRAVSLRGVDAAHLMLTDIDLTDCRFLGTVHLDQLRLEGNCPLPAAPSGLRRRGIRPERWTPRRTLAEEQHWRAARRTAPSGWTPAPDGIDVLEPGTLAPVYRHLRKAFEDAKNEPGAADFYYGEMEMRRHDTTGTARAERALLHCYWLLSGYGLRASRALAWLGATMLVTIVLLMSFGLPREEVKQEATGTVPPGGGVVHFELTKRPPENPADDRFTGTRFEKSLNITFNSVLFRASTQDLTTTGTYTELTSRLLGPLLLGLSVLAVRNRVKR